jgi:hypothetical protein
MFGQAGLKFSGAARGTIKITVGFALRQQIKVFTESSTMQQALATWKAGDTLCACAFVASILLHEISHVCGRDRGDGNILRDCPFAVMLENSVLSMVAQRYPELQDSPCCSYMADLGKWWSDEIEDLAPGCES